MKRNTEPLKPRRKWRPSHAGSPGRRVLAKQRLRLVSIDPDSDKWLAQAAASVGRIKRSL